MDRAAEKELMEFCREALGDKSYQEWAGYWRICIRGNANHPPKPGKVRRVMQAVLADRKEAKQFDDVGAYAYDLFSKRFAD